MTTCKKKGGKKAIIIIRKTVKDAVPDPFLKYLSPLQRVNTLIIKGLKNRGDSDRCFATFYFSLPLYRCCSMGRMEPKPLSHKINFRVQIVFMFNRFLITFIWQQNRVNKIGKSILMKITIYGLLTPIICQML